MAARSNPDRALGERIRLRRAELGLTQEELAARLGLSYQQIQKYESGASRITVTRLLEIAEALDAPAARFIGNLRGAEPATSPEARVEEEARTRVLGELARNLLGAEDEAVRSAMMGLLRAVAERAAPG